MKKERKPTDKEKASFNKQLKEKGKRQSSLGRVFTDKKKNPKLKKKKKKPSYTME